MKQTHEVQFHNVEGDESAIEGGRLLARYPREIRAHLSPRGRMMGGHSGGTEVRFVTPSSDLQVAFSALEQETELIVYRGAFEVARATLQPGTVRRLHLTAPPRFAISEPNVLRCRSWLSADLLHPTELGHANMGRELAECIRPHLSD